MQSAEKPRKSRLWVLRLLTLALIAVTIYGVKTLEQTGSNYDQLSAEAAKESLIVEKAQIGSGTITIPTYSLFDTGNIWALVSKKHPLEGEAGYELIDIPVAHGDAGQPMKIAQNISVSLQKLVNAAEADGEPLMVSSAYRSLKEQQEIYDDFVEESGEAAAKQYVLPVGASEHHTGLSVDFSSISDECAEDSDSCSLSQSGAAWLAENAYRFGFIQRYPSGKQEITSVGFEPWHYRFIGIPLAKAMQNSGLTFDEVVEQIAPGYAKSR